MNRSKLLQEVRKMRFEELYNQFRSNRLTCEEAEELLGSSVSTFYPYRRRYDEEGFAGLADRRIGKLSHRRAPVDEVMKVLTLFETKYHDFTVKHFHEKLGEHGLFCSLAIFHGPRRLANYTPGRELIAKKIKDLAA